jgi:bifunctional non-homologous end joining protein LigD
MQPEKISLYYKDGSSDKVYHCQLEPSDTGWVVNFQYGRRGQTLQSGTKTSSPVSSDQAKKIYDKLVKEKTSKGYSPDSEGTPFQGTDKAGEVSGLVPQLLNSIEEDEVQKYLHDPLWIMQEKHDGVRLMTRVEKGTVTGSNKKGLVVPISKIIEAGVVSLLGGGAAVLDGEAIGDTYWVFDLLEIDGENLRKCGAEERYLRLQTLFGVGDGNKAVQLVTLTIKPWAKQQMFDSIKFLRGEGVVFKHRNSPYVPGRPNSGGNQLKFKFKGSATCKVSGTNPGKRSVGLLVLDENPLKPGQLAYRDIGNVTILVNFPIPANGQLVEVEYLYAFKGGSLFQAVYKGPRTDQDDADLYSSLKFKAENADEDEL